MRHIEKSKVDIVAPSPRNRVRRTRVEEVKALAGKIALDIDLDRSRRRPREQPRSHPGR